MMCFSCHSVHVLQTLPMYFDEIHVEFCEYTQYFKLGFSKIIYSS